MKFINQSKIIEETLDSYYEEETFKLPKRLGEKIYSIPFKLLINYDLVRTFAINRSKLISNYVHHLEQEQFDEN